MYLIVGLGNPGEEYTRTRHNMGFEVIDKLAEKYNIKVSKHKFDGLYGKGEIEGEKVVLLKPQTYMNLSGNAVGQFVSFFKVEQDEIIVIYDDIDIPTGTIKIRKQGSAGSHNGMKSVINELATEKFPRIRIGTGTTEKIYDLVDYVLEKIKEDEYKKLEESVDMAQEAIIQILQNGIDNAMNKYN